MSSGMPAWSPPALAGALFIAIHYLLLRGASGRIGDFLGALVLEGSAAAGLGVSLLLIPRETGSPTSRAGVVLAVGSGLAVAVASVLTFATLRRGGPVASTGTIVLGGGVALSALAAPWIFGESFTGRRLLGVGLGLAAMWVLGSES
jgi:drug/metabolite transporter (DMT)-like permease